MNAAERNQMTSNITDEQWEMIKLETDLLRANWSGNTERDLATYFNNLSEAGIRAYPISIGSMELNENKILREFSVTFNYHS